jgi:hypothetical protein
MNAPTPRAHYQAMADQAQRDSRRTGLDAANTTSARGPVQAVKRSAPLLISQYLHEGIAFNVHGTGHETGKCVIEEIKVAQCAINFYRLIPADVICAMTAECDRQAAKELTATPYANDAIFRRR